MITLCIILFIVLIFAYRKDKHDHDADDDQLAQRPPFSIKAKPMSTISKLANLALLKSQLIDTFSYSNKSICIVMQNGKSISAPLKDIFVDFEKVRGIVEYKIKYNKQSVNFYKTTNISNKEWDAINSVLCLAGSTRGRSTFSKEAKYLGYVGTALKAIKALS